MSVKFKVGDRVRLVSINKEGYLHEDTLQVLERLRTLKRVVKISEIEEGNTPWVEFRLKNMTTGQFEHHSLSMLFDVWEKVE